MKSFQAIIFAAAAFVLVVPLAAGAATQVIGGTAAAQLTASSPVNLSTLELRCIQNSDISGHGITATLTTSQGTPDVQFDLASVPVIQSTGNTIKLGDATFSAQSLSIPVTAPCVAGEKVTIANLRVKLASHAAYGNGSAWLKVETDGGTTSASAFNVYYAEPTPLPPPQPPYVVPPALTGGVYYDTNTDGLIDSIVLNFSKPVQYPAFSADNWSITNPYGTWNVTSAQVAGSVITLSVSTVTYYAGGGGTNVVLTYYGTAVADAATASAKLPSGSAVVLVDQAPPVLISTSPLAGQNYLIQSGGKPTDPVRLTFSEPVVGGGVTISPTVGSLSLSYSGSNVFVSHAAFSPGVTYTVYPSGFVAAANSQGAIAPAWSFTYADAQPSGAISINGGDYLTNIASVVISLYSPTATFMRLSNSGDFTGISFESYQTQKAWVLPGGDGPKTVCVQFKTLYGATSSTYCDSIILQIGGAADTGMAPINPSILISGGASKTVLPQVTLSLSASGANEMIISNNPDFLGASWVAYTTTKSWILKSGNGQKTVYAQFRAANGAVSNVVSDTITLEIKPPTTSIPFGSLIKGSGATVYYYGFDGLRHAYPSLPVYLSWYPDFKSVKKVSDIVLASIPVGGNITVRPGTYLLKFGVDPKVYGVEPGGVIRWIPGEGTAKALYGIKWGSLVRDIDESLFIDYVVGASLDETAHPTGTVIQKKAFSAAYYIESGMRRYITSVNVFGYNGLQWKFVVISKLPYIDGPDVNSSEDAIRYPHVSLPDGTIQKM